VLGLRGRVARSEAQGAAEDGKQQRKLAFHRSFLLRNFARAGASIDVSHI
jgi:hypothetical protein